MLGPRDLRCLLAHFTKSYTACEYLANVIGFTWLALNLLCGGTLIEVFKSRERFRGRVPGFLEF